MRALPLLALVCTLATASSRALESRKTVSLSRQFIVYCEDGDARARIAGFAEQTKKNLLSLLGESDHWKLPIVIQVKSASVADPSAPASRLLLAITEDGGKLALDVVLGSDPREARFEQQLVRALLLEFAYRNALPAAGSVYAEPPAWLVEGAVGIFHKTDSDASTDLFKRIIAGNELPSLADFLAGNSESAGSTSRDFYAACATSLVQLLIDLPEGRHSLAAMLRHLNRDSGDPAGALIKNFPVLGASSQSLEKWWTLSMARLSTADRYRGLSLAESETQLAAILSFEIPAGTDNAPQTFTLDQFEQFRKLPASRRAMEQLQARLLALGVEVSPLLRPVLASYQEIARQLARGKTRGVQERLADAARYRQLLLTRLDQIADYLNWFEATQQSTKTDSFEGYFKTAKEIAREGSGREDPISRYLDVVQGQMQ